MSSSGRVSRGSVAELAALLAWDVWLLRTGRDAISTRLRRRWRQHPVVASLVCVGLVWHLTRPDRWSRYDLLSVAGGHIRRR